MVDISQLNLSDDLLSKCKEKNIKSLSENEWKSFTALSNGSSVALDSSLGCASYTTFLIKKLESIKKLKTSRKPRLIAIVESKEACDKLTVELKSFITKDLNVVSLHSEISLKRSKKKLENPIDIIVGTAQRIGELINLELLSIKNVKNVIILNFENVKLEEVEIILTHFDETDFKNKCIQLIVTTSTFNKSLKTFMEKHSKESYETIENSIVLSEDSDEESSEDSSSEDDIKVKVNGNINKNTDVNSNDENNDVKEQGSSEVDAKNNNYDIDETLMSKIRSFTDMEKYNLVAKLLIEEFGDVELVSRILGVMLSDKSHSDSLSKKSKPVYTGTGSKLTRREGYTAYHFTTDKEIQNKGYLFKSLKRLIEEDIVEKIERIQNTKDFMGFVFDLPSEYDETFQGSWRDGKFDAMQLLEDNIPELVDSGDRRSMSGGNRGRGNDRGGFRGRGNDRGGYRGRGGRGNDRGGIKRSASAHEGNNSSKVIKFD